MSKVVKLPPLKCSECKGTNITKSGKNELDCNDCNKKFNLKTGKVTIKDRNRFPRGYNPRLDTGDYLE